MKFFAPSSRSLLISSCGQSTAAHCSRWALAVKHNVQQRASTLPSARAGFTRRALSAATAAANQQSAARRTSLVAFMGVIAMTVDYNNRTSTGVLSLGALPGGDICSCDASRKGSKGVPSSGDVLSVGKITNEPVTKIAFPALCNAMSLAGVGVRVKYIFVNVYAVGAYFDPIAMMAVKKGSQDDIEKALVDPTYPRTIRIVMNRGLSVDKFIAAMNEAIEPRLNGKNLNTLVEFKEIFPKVDLVEGDEIELTIRGDTLLLKTGLGVGTVKSRPFTEAMCDVYFGKDPVSPTLKADVLNGVRSL